MHRLPQGNLQFLLSVAKVPQMSQWLQAHSQTKGLAMAGISNVGKSTLINALFSQKTAHTAKTPGRTSNVNIFQFEFNRQIRYLYDLPGYGYARVSRSTRRQWDELMNCYFQFLRPATAIVHIQDARHPHRAADREFHRYLEQFQLPYFLVFNKLDKLKKQSDQARAQKSLQDISSHDPKPQEVFSLSAQSGQGLAALKSSLAQFLS